MTGRLVPPPWFWHAENLLIARNSPALAARYAKNWEWHRQDAAPYKK